MYLPVSRCRTHSCLTVLLVAEDSATGHKTQIVFRTFREFKEFKEVPQMKRHNARPPIISGNNSFSPSGLLQIACKCRWKKNASHGTSFNQYLDVWLPQVLYLSFLDLLIFHYVNHTNTAMSMSLEPGAHRFATFLNICFVWPWIDRTINDETMWDVHFPS